MVSSFVSAKSDMEHVLRLSLDDTQVLKGLALILLLCHHCWYTGEGFDDVFIAGIPVFKNIGIFSKLCVAMFVFLSGYGLTIQAKRQGGITSVIRFYRRRYLKLMANFWLIWLLFVPMGVFVFHRTFADVYGNHYVFRALADLTGLCTSTSYNSTWWFYGCIMVLYALFPLMWQWRRLWFLILPTAVALPTFLIHVPILNMVGGYLFVFVCGAVFANSRIFAGG